ncbi:two pore domain potassium channel family protein [Caballeronia sp. BCC1704]|uniref:two pore domain potassium channel family protein n=1 Tax=Caballeronia sp. BCC1704 TaxID=2676300 RepID=UPI00158AB8E2|nr:two pore domain potassium channel family protein [Caballeronia sp. BCC1704]
MRLFGQLVGAAIMICTLADIFLTILYARVGRGRAKRLGAGLISLAIAQGVWAAFRRVPLKDGPKQETLSFAGPLILVLLLVTWTLCLTLGDALLLWPALGDSVRSSSGPTPTGFPAAVYAAATSLSITGSSDFIPHTNGYRMIYLVGSFIGTAVVTLTLSYLLQLYGALQRQNTLGQQLFFLTRETGDAVELIQGLAVGQHPETAYSMLADAAQSLSSVHESLRIYPITFFFRYPEPHFSLAAISFMALETVSLLRACLRDDAPDLLKHGGAVEVLWRGALSTLDTLDGAYVRSGRRIRRADADLDDDTRAAWAEHYGRAAEKLRGAGLKQLIDDGGADEYVRQRAVWNGLVMSIAQYAAVDLDNLGASSEQSTRERRLGS